MTKPHRPLMLVLVWLSGLVRRRTGRLAATALGVALAVGLLASIGAFLSSSKATMTARAVATVAVDWQVETQPGGDAAAVARQVTATPHVVAAEPVLFGRASGFQVTTGGTTQTTGAGQVLGLSDTYRTTFPAQVRTLVGSARGAVLFQQTAANLQAKPGDTVTVILPGVAAATVTVSGVVDLPQADSLFQPVGAPVGAQPQAPPDNVLLLPTTQWHRLFDPLRAARPDLVHSQVHVRLDHQLPHDPAAAFSTATGQARNLEVKLAGTGLVGDNLGATLSAARGDALYAQILFLFLGLPGAVLAGLLTATTAGAGRDRRRRDQALLRTRGATTRQLTYLGLAEALAVGLVGGGLGLGLALLVGRTAFQTTSFGATTAAAIGWSVAAVAFGLAIAAAAVAVPAWRDARDVTVVAARREVGRAGDPRWIRWYLDVGVLTAALVVFAMSSRNGYKLVLVVEGVAAISVSYWAFAGPALLWVGAGLLAFRLTNAMLTRGRAALAIALVPVAGPLSSTVAASLHRQRRTLAHGVALVALTIGFAASTAVFNSTYRQQAAVDAVLSNGADVTATPSPGAAVSPTSSIASALATVRGVRHVESIQHRYAYVGADLQDLYGVNPATIVSAGRLQDSYVQGGSAAALMRTLAAQPDGLLVSAETVHDFQLLPGDLVKLRLQDGATKAYREVPFHYVGVAKEFPTAPRDSFLIANADYVAKATGSDAVGAFLIDTGGRNITSVASQVRAKVGTTAAVTDLATTRKLVGSSLTAVDLAGLTRVELGFAFALAAAATGLTLWLGLAERRRTFAIATALGARSRQLGAFVWAEASVVTLTGLVTGGVSGWALSKMLVRVLTGVFDPAPSSLAVPWAYLVALLTAATLATVVGAVATLVNLRRPRMDLLRTS